MSALIGIEITNKILSNSEEVNFMLPQCFSIIFFVIDKPRPLPLELQLSAFTKGSNIVSLIDVSISAPSLPIFKITLFSFKPENK